MKTEKNPKFPECAQWVLTLCSSVSVPGEPETDPCNCEHGTCLCNIDTKDTYCRCNDGYEGESVEIRYSRLKRHNVSKQMNIS